MIPDDIIQKAQNLLDIAISLGYSRESAIGVCANIMAESNFSEGASEIGGIGFGLGQWTPSENLYSQGAILGYSRSDCLTFEVQSKILLQGDKTGQWSVVANTGYDPLVTRSLTLDEFKQQTDYIKSTVDYMAHWERPSENPEINHVALRKSYAQEFNEKLNGESITSGLQLPVFPIQVDCVLTQGENDAFSHKDSSALDIAVSVGIHVPYYAPCDIVVKEVLPSYAQVAWESVQKVHYVDGTEDYLSFYTVHDNISRWKVGDTFLKGAFIGETGTGGNASGDHLHIETARGKYAGGNRDNGFSYNINNPYPVYKVFSTCSNITKKQITITNGTGRPENDKPWVCMLNYDDKGKPKTDDSDDELIMMMLCGAIGGLNY